MKKTLLILFTALCFSVSISAAPDSVYESNYYYLFEYALLQGLSPFAISGQKQAESRITDPSFSILMSQSYAMGFLPSYIGLNIRLMDSDSYSIYANGSGSVQFHEDYLGMTGALGGAVDFKDYGKISLDFSTITQWFGPYGPGYEDYDGKHFFTSALELYTGKFFDSPLVPSSIEIKAIHGDQLIDGFVSSFIYNTENVETPFLYSIGHSGRLNMFFGEVYCVNPFDERFSFNLGYLSDSPFINSIGVNYDFITGYNRKHGIKRTTEQDKKAIVRLELGVEYKAYTDWQQDYYDASEHSFAVNITFRMLANLDDKSSGTKNTMGTEINGGWFTKLLYDTITGSDNPDISRTISMFAMSGQGEAEE